MSLICNDNKYGLRPILSAERLRADHILSCSEIRSKDGSLSFHGLLKASHRFREIP